MLLKQSKLKQPELPPTEKPFIIIRISWNSLSGEEQLAVQLHEMLHIVNCHAARKDCRDHVLWNIACDIAINYQIIVSGYKLPSGALDGENSTAEKIYDLLLQKIEFISDGQSGRKKTIYIGSGSNGNACPDIGNMGEKTLKGDMLERNADGSKTCFDESTQEAVESAAQLAGHGSSPLAKRFQPRVAKADWRSVLQHYVKSALGDELDYLSYEFDEFGVCEDVMSAKPISKICVFVDESGSIEDELYEQFIGELSKMNRFALVYASGFTDSTELNAVLLKQYHRTMTGGTDVRPAYEQACKKDFDCIIVLTDGFLEFPEKK